MNTKHAVIKGSQVPTSKIGVSFQHPQGTMGGKK